MGWRWFITTLFFCFFWWHEVRWGEQEQTIRCDMYGVSWSGFLHLASNIVQLVWFGNFSVDTLVFRSYLLRFGYWGSFLVSSQGEFGCQGVYKISHQFIQQISPTSRSPVALSGDLGRVGRYSDHQLAYLGMAWRFEDNPRFEQKKLLVVSSRVQ